LGIPGGTRSRALELTSKNLAGKRFAGEQPLKKVVVKEGGCKIAPEADRLAKSQDLAPEEAAKKAARSLLGLGSQNGYGDLSHKRKNQ